MRGWAWFALLALPACGGDRDAPTSDARRLAITAPILSAERATDAPVLVPSTESQFHPVAASDGTGYLVAWNDAREGGGIWAARLDANGELLDPTGLIVHGGPWITELDVAFDGASYVVAWGNQAIANKGAYAVRVAKTGTVLDATPIQLSATGVGARVTSGLQGSLVVWTDWNGTSSQLLARRVAKDGSLLGSAPTPIAKNAADADVAFDGSSFLVVWRASDSIRAARLTPEGTVVNTMPIVVAYGGEYPRVTAGASGFVVSWREGFGAPARLARVTAGGSVLEPGGVVLAGSAGQPDVGFDGSGFLSVFMGKNADDVFGARFTPAGVFLDASPFPITTGSDDQGEPRVASKPGEHLVLWPSSPLGTASDVVARRVASDGKLIGPGAIDVALGANPQSLPAVASDGQGFLWVWEDQRGVTGRDLFSARVTADGGLLGSGVVAVATAIDGQEAPRVAFDSQRYFVVWHDRRDGELDVYGARVDAQGQVLDPGGFVIAGSSAAEAFPAVASNGAVSLVAWAHGGGFAPDVHGARVAMDGTVLDPAGFVVAGGPGSQGSPVVASDGQHFLVAWSDAPSGEIRVARVDAAGALLGPAPLVAATGSGERHAFGLAFGGGVYLLTWVDGRHAPKSGNWDVYAARITPGGAVLDPAGVRVTQAPAVRSGADATWDGSTFVVAWSGETDARAARIDASGVLHDPDGFVVSPPGAKPDQVRVAATATGTSLLTYARYDGAAEFRSSRVRARTLNFAELPDAGSDADADAAIADAAGPDGAAGQGGSATDDTRRVPLEPVGGCGCRASAALPAFGCTWFFSALTLAAIRRRRRRARERVACAP